MVDRMAPVALVLWCVMTAPLHAQQRLELGVTRACTACTIELERVVTLGDREGEGYVGFPVGVGQLSDGEWVLVQDEHMTQIAVFAADGTFRRRVGRMGGGPGEFRQIMHLSVDPSDSVFAYDAMARRLNVLDGSLNVRRTVLFPAMPSELAFQRDGGIVVGGSSALPDRHGYPLHLFSRAGEHVRSFARIDHEHRPRENLDPLVRSMASAGDGRIWSARYTEYVVELWTTAGDQLAELRRDVDWFEPHENGGFNGDDPPNPTLASIHVDAEGRLWSLVRVAGEDWRRGVGQGRHPYGHMVNTVVDRSLYYDVILEVFDPRTGDLLATRRFPQHIQRFTSQGFLYGYREDAEGYPFVDVFRVRFDPGR
jgi:6-bladed beta-propeller